MENYNSLWKILDALVAEFRRKSGTVPQEIIDDLKSAKTMISVLNADPSSIEIITELESLLGKIEATLLFLVEADFGKEYANEFSKRIMDMRMGGFNQEIVSTPRFIAGIPRRAHWIRFKIDDIMGRMDVEGLAHGLGLSYKWQNNDLIIIYGDKEKIKTFIQKVAEKTDKSKRK